MREALFIVTSSPRMVRLYNYYKHKLQHACMVFVCNKYNYYLSIAVVLTSVWTAKVYYVCAYIE